MNDNPFGKVIHKYDEHDAVRDGLLKYLGIWSDKRFYLSQLVHGRLDARFGEKPDLYWLAVRNLRDLALKMFETPDPEDYEDHQMRVVKDPFPRAMAGLEVIWFIREGDKVTILTPEER